MKTTQNPPDPQPKWNWRKTVRTFTGVLLGAVGLLYCVPTPYQEKPYLIHASGCELVTSVIEPPGGIAEGYVILLHGLAANRKIMAYVARNFALQGMRVYVPDLPGHGRTAGPFSPASAEECTEALLKDLLAHGAVVPERTLMVGHSMGAAIAIRVAAREQVAGVIAISPAPMRPEHGARADVLLFTDPPSLPANTLVLSGGWEPDSLRGNAHDLFKGDTSNGSKYLVLPRATHVSLLFDGRMGAESRKWAANLLHLQPSAGYVSRNMLWGWLAGFIGILFIAGPFLEEACGSKKVDEKPATESSGYFPIQLGLFTAVSLGAVGILKFWNPLKQIGVFEGDYLTGFFLLSGIVVIALNWKAMRALPIGQPSSILGPAFAAVALLLLITGWFELTISEAWITSARWARFPILLMALFPYCMAEELVLGSTSRFSGWRRFSAGSALRLVGWLALLVGLLALRSGAILILLLAPYLGLFYALQRLGMDVVRKGTGSAAAAALFGAILLAGLCLVIFPVT